MDETFRIQCEKDPTLEERSRLIEERVLRRKDEIMAARKRRGVKAPDGRVLRIREKTPEELGRELDGTNPFD